MFRKKINNKILLTIPYLIISLVFLVIPTIMIFIKPFIQVDNYSIADNWNFIDNFIWSKILITAIDAFITTIVCILISYPLAYFIAFDSSRRFRVISLLLVTTPIWMSFLIKLTGLKTFFDTCNGYENSTSGEIFTIIGLVYLYLPFMVLPIYNVLSDLPKNLIFASKDLGHNSWTTFISVIVPYTKNALFSGITLVFLPSLTTVAVSNVLNNQPSGSLIGSILMDEGQLAITSQISLARVSTLSLIIILLLLMGWILIMVIKKTYLKLMKK